MPYSVERKEVATEEERFTIGDMAEIASVSIRTLRYYDQIGLLNAADHTDAGYRLYSSSDLTRLQQILALKFLGFSLTQIRDCLRRDCADLRSALARQKAMMRERREQVDAVIRAIEHVENRLTRKGSALDDIIVVIKAIQMQQNDEWVSKYFSEEQRAGMDELSRACYSDAARAKLGAREWTETDQERVSAEWAWVAAEAKRLTEAGADTEGEEWQAVAKKKEELLFAFTQGDPEIAEGLNRFWSSHNSLPVEQQPLTHLVPPEVIPGSTNAAAEQLERAWNTRDRGIK